MTLLEFKQYIQKKKNGSIFPVGISEPFSWRGSYNEVAFSIVDQETTKEDILTKIEKAYNEIFIGYKGGNYRYDDYTKIHFEENPSDYTAGTYVKNELSKLLNKPIYLTLEEQFVCNAFL